MMPLKTALVSLPRIITIAFAVLVFVQSASASINIACACCAEPGEWYERTEKIDSYELDEFRRIKFGPLASVYLTAVGFEDLKGLPGEYASYNLSHIFNPGGSMTLKLKTERGQTGSLVLSLPKTAISFGADLHEGEGEPVLYKEWRFEGMVSGSGIFKKGVVRGSKFRLILQGRGNNCVSAEDFKNWRLQITGTRASYAFYGSLNSPK
jgi:hypothetical protein